MLAFLQGSDVVFYFILLVIVSCCIPTMLNRVCKLSFIFLSGKYSMPLINRGNSYSNTYILPPIAVHLAIRSEDPAVVLPTLVSLTNQTYSNFKIFVVDNNTTDKSLYIPIKHFCDVHKDKCLFYHVSNLKGFKAGALNYALSITPDQFELIAIVDADNLVEPNFLAKMAAYFSDSKVAIVQSPLGFIADPVCNPFHSWIFMIYRYFLTIYMPAAGSMNCSPFIGGMGVLRKKALLEIGGWNSYYLTEDMEIGYRLFSVGYRSIFVNYPYGKSMPPPNLASFKRQHFRWNFGNAQLYRDWFINLVKLQFRIDKFELKKMIYFVCPGIYINTYLLIFTSTSLFIEIGSLFNFQIDRSYYISSIMLFILSVEILGEVIMLRTVALRESYSTKLLIKNLIGWWSLSFTNSVSTVAVLFRKTCRFQITDKTGNKSTSKFLACIFETLFSMMCLGTATASLIAKNQVNYINLLVLALVGFLLITPAIISFQKS